MLKFIKHHMDTIAGIGIYPVIAFVLFLTIFMAVLWWVQTVDKRHLDRMNRLPLSDH
ncbi:MAG: CcoQ/FixQ family Cbb3-type cytochrome c oxidase assembly chaperone [Flavobacteriales bacterium]|nr:CcoQ/FixQ family Cbb3-type cytochrome c oxidase assembly chaperone [Flavobacteriales bacterium]